MTDADREWERWVARGSVARLKRTPMLGAWPAVSTLANPSAPQGPPNRPGSGDDRHLAARTPVARRRRGD